MKVGASDVAQIDDLPDELRQVIELKKQQRDQRLEAISAIFARKRDEAVTARKESGIERIWREDNEYYLGIDDANRATHTYTKSMSTSGGLTGNTAADKSSGGATAFFNMTRQFVDSASARMGDILLPAGDWNFAIKPTPVPDLETIKGSNQPVVDPQGNTPKNADGSPYTLGQFAAEEAKDAEQRVTKAETRIRDWLTECSYHSEVRKMIEDAARIGTGVLRGAFPANRKSRVIIDGELIIKEEIIPASKRIDPRDFFPDPNCGDNIQNGSYVIERDLLSPRQLRALKGMPGYIDSAIEKVLKEGAGKKNVRDGYERNAESEASYNDDDRFEVFYCFGDVNIDDLDAFGVETDNYAKDSAPAVVTLVNDTIIKGVINPLDNGEFPYDVMQWQRNNDSVWGVGVARQGRVPQEMLNASARTLMRNMGLSGAPQIIIRQSAIQPVDGDWTLVAGKFWYATEESDIRNVGDAFQSINIPTMQQEIQNVIQLAYKMMEDATGISFLLQGQQGSAPDTVGGMELLHKNSSALLRRIARVFDECVTEPHIRRYYDWLLIHGKDEEKGDLQIDAIGSTALVEREIQANQAAQILQMSLNPAFQMSPAKAKDELLRAWRFEPTKFDLDEEEKSAMQQQQPAPAPAVQAAQIRAQSAEKIEQATMQHEQEMLIAKLDHDAEMDKNNLDRDTAYNNSIAQRDRMTYEARIAEMNMRKELAMMEYANRHQVTIEQIKAKLSDSVMKLNTQKELSMAALEVDAQKHVSSIKADLHKHNTQVMTPPTEPVGRAPNGQAFEA